MIKFRINRRYLLTRYAGYTWKDAMNHTCDRYNCTYDNKSDTISCTEEDYLIIQLQCPDMIDKRVISFKAWCLQGNR